MPDMRCFCQTFNRVILAILLAPCLTQAAAPLFARFTTDRKTLYAGEAFQLTLGIYVSGASLDKQISIAGLPAPADLQIRSFEELPIETVTVDGMTYECRPFRTWARAPHPCVLTLAPLLDGTRVSTTRSHFFMQESRSPVRIKTDPLVLAIRALPDTGRPADFSGLVGRYTFSAVAAPLDVAPGDLITLTLTLSGDWFPGDFAPPRLVPCPGLKVYDLKPVPEECTPSRQVFRQTVVAQDAGIAAVPAIHLVTFDTATGVYTTRTAGPFPLRHHAERVTPSAIYVPAPRPPTNPMPQPPVTASTTENRWGRLWKRWMGHEDMVLQGTGDISVRLAPAESARELFTLKPGTPVTRDSADKEWIRISCPKGIGWIRQQDAAQ